MEAGPLNNPRFGSDSQDSDEPLPPGVTRQEGILLQASDKKFQAIPPTPKGVDLAKKRLRAFSIQKKSLSPISVPKPVSTGTATVFIGKLAGAKPVQAKPEPDPTAELKKPPKPPKPGANRSANESYIFCQKKTLEEIEDMKRKMELVDLGIPLGLICPTPNSDKAMPTKAMPPIKSFIDAPTDRNKKSDWFSSMPPAKVDEIIREAKKARAEGKEFKFDYHKLLPDYDNPFQRKKDDHTEVDQDGSKSKDKRKSTDSGEGRKYFTHKREDKHRYKDDKHIERGDKYKSREDKYLDKEEKYRDKSKDKKKSRHSESRYKDRDNKSTEREYKQKESSRYRKRDKKSAEREHKKQVDKNEPDTDVDLKDFLVCDSWSETEEKPKDCSPKDHDKDKSNDRKLTPDIQEIDPLEQLRECLVKDRENSTDSPKPKIEKLAPVIDAFKFEIEDNDDIFDVEENSATEDYAKRDKLVRNVYDSPVPSKHYDMDSRDGDMDDIADDTFLESVINEIKQEELDDNSQDKGLVEYDESPVKDNIRESVTPELDDRFRELNSSRSDYSDGYKSVDSGCKSNESGYKSTDSLKLSESFKSDSELDKAVFSKLTKFTVDSLETWSFVLKICQPLLFRHDKNKCYKETRTCPNIWFTENPKLCNCVKDRRLVYQELEMCKMDLVTALYSSEQVPETPQEVVREWYPHSNRWPLAGTKLPPAEHLTASQMSASQTSASQMSASQPSACQIPTGQMSSEWEAEDSQPEPQSATPDRADEILLDKEYQRFMQAVWPEVTEPKSETPRSTPVRREQKKKLEDLEPKDERKPKKMKLSSEGWSQESEIEEEPDKCFTIEDFLSSGAFEALSNSYFNVTKKKDKQKRKRKHSTTSATDSSESEAKKRKKMKKKKDNKKSKSKRRRLLKKSIKKLKSKHNKKKKVIELDEESDNQDFEKEKKKRDMKIKKKKQLKQKNKSQKKKKSRAKSSSSSSDSSSESEPQEKTKKKRSDKKKKRRHSTDSNHSQDLFDVNILNNIKTERLTDEEKIDHIDFRKQKHREIINVKELQNDFVGIQIKQEVEDKRQIEEPVVEKLEDESQQSSTEKVEEEKEQRAFESVKQLPAEETSQSTPLLRMEESNQSQCSSQESVYSVKDQPPYEKDDSHLRPSSQNSNYSFQDVMTSGMYSKNVNESQESQRSESQIDIPDHARLQESQSVGKQDTMSQEQASSHSVDHAPRSMDHAPHSMDHAPHSMAHAPHSMDHAPHSMDHANHGMEHVPRHELELDSQDYATGDYEMYEQMAMAYQSDAATQSAWASSSARGESARAIETVVRARARGEIKCDWRAGDSLARAPPRPSRWGLKPGEVNIVLTGGGDFAPPSEPVYQIQSIANRTENANIGYDEAYMDMYGASDRLQYGDCFSTAPPPASSPPAPAPAPAPGASLPPARPPGAPADPRRAPRTKLDDRIDLALRTTVLGDVASANQGEDKDAPEKGILITACVAEGRGVKRVSFADGYKPGQDSDVEEPPVKKKRKPRRVGCPWPCPASHPDHVPLWDALPPPPPPPGSPPPAHALLMHKLDSGIPAFMPPEPPPGIITF